MAAPILNLDTLADRPVVNIDGTPYELITHDSLSPLNAHRVSRYHKRIGALLEKSEASDLTGDEESELEALPALICRLILDAPAEVQDKLTDKQRALVVSTFWRMLPNRQPAVSTSQERAATESPTSTGVN
jgi:hypothetical protein